MRIFIALDLPEEARSALGEVAAWLRRSWPALSWVGGDNYHLTLAFLGEQDERGVDCARRALAPLAGSMAPRIAGSRVGTFPPRGPWRVLVIEFEASPALSSLHEALNLGLLAEARSRGLPPPNAEYGDDPRETARTFRPHLTLARRPRERHDRDGRDEEAMKVSRHRAPERLDPRILAEAGELFREKTPPGGWPLGPVVLYKSELRREGALYTELARADLLHA